MLRARSSCGSGGEPEKGVYLAGGEHFLEIAGGCGDPVDVLVRVEPNLRRHGREEQVAARARLLWDSDPPALKVTDGSDGFVREQLVAAGMHPRQRGNWLAGIHVRDDPCGGMELEVEIAVRDSIHSRTFHEPNVGEPFRAQQGLRDQARRYADGGNMFEPERGGFRRSFVGERSPGIKDARGRGQ
jgi:hypothetical protein